MTTNTPTTPLFPEVEVQLSGQDGNAFFIASRVRQAIAAAGKDHRRAGDLEESRRYEQAATDYFNEALDGSYDDLLVLSARTVTIL